MLIPQRYNNLPLDVRKDFDFTHAVSQQIGGLSIVIPIRGLDRQKNVEYCLSRLLMQNVEPLEIIVVEEDYKEQIRLDRFCKDKRVRKIYVRSGTTPFNKSIAINVGVINAKYEKILMNDADIVLPKNYCYEIDKILNEYESVFLAKTIYNVNLIQNSIVFAGTKRTDHFSGGSIGFTKAAFEKIGGMCEKFYGYGSEDCEFWQRIQAVTKLHEKREKNILHINHKRINSFSQNVDIYNEINAISMEDRIKLLQKSYIMRKSAGVVT